MTVWYARVGSYMVVWMLEIHRFMAFIIFIVPHIYAFIIKKWDGISRYKSLLELTTNLVDPMIDR